MEAERDLAALSIAAAFDWRFNRVWFVVDGNVDAAEFRKRATAQASASGVTFDSRRWSCDDDELLHLNGKTYTNGPKF